MKKRSSSGEESALKTASDTPPDIMLRAIIAGTSSSVGEGFFRDLVRNLAIALQTNIAFVSEVVDGRAKTLRLRANWTQGRYDENFEYAIEGTPCEQVMSQDVAFFGTNVQERFPDDEWLKTVGALSYLAIPLLASDSTPLGHLGIVDDKPIDRVSAEPILRIFAARAGSELERERLDADLHRNEEHLRTLVDEAPVGILSVGGEGEIIDANQAIESLFGYRREELVGQPIETLVPESARSEHASYREVFMRSPGRRPMGERMNIMGRRKDGTLFPVEIGLSSFRTTTDDSVYVAFVTDAEQSRTLAALRESEARLAALVAGVPDMMFVMRSDGTLADFVLPEGQKPFVSPVGRVGQPIRDILPVEIAELHIAAMKRALESGEIQRFEYAGTIDGQEHTRECRMVPMPPDRAMAVIRDITAEHQIGVEEQGRLSARRDSLEEAVEKRMAEQNPYDLTFREFSVLHQLKSGETDKEISNHLGISVYTVNKHVSNILSKMQASSRTEATIRALQEGLID